jgi:DNA-directed RNA polymerase subunit RPC12/RpoP
MSKNMSAASRAKKSVSFAPLDRNKNKNHDEEPKKKHRKTEALSKDNDTASSDTVSDHISTATTESKHSTSQKTHRGERDTHPGNVIPTTQTFTADQIRPEAFVSECQCCRSLVMTPPTGTFRCPHCHGRILLKVRPNRTTNHKADVGTPARVQTKTRP